MLIRDRKYRACKSCKTRHIVSSEVYGCDTCKKPIDLNKKGTEYLESTVFRNNEETQRIHACNWKCMMKALRKVKSDYFVSMPFLHYDNATADGLRADDFFALLRK